MSIKELAEYVYDNVQGLDCLKRLWDDARTDDDDIDTLTDEILQIADPSSLFSDVGVYDRNDEERVSIVKDTCRRFMIEHSKTDWYDFVNEPIGSVDGGTSESVSELIYESVYGGVY